MIMHLTHVHLPTGNTYVKTRKNRPKKSIETHKFLAPVTTKKTKPPPVEPL
ncbi:hypothetical protein MNBD_ALPHA11-706 [hydrothermal vent metagenome]|uniref:Uncharacterized protein n=1 Tax=hydrothermal vent metagenome TaxID=652676 RepID=A0A3B0UZK4_9ZZZZ